MRVDVTSHGSWANYQREQDSNDKPGDGSREAEHNRPVVMPGRNSEDQTESEIATQAIVAVEALEAVDQFSEAMQRVYTSMSSGKDATEDIVALMQPLDNLMRMLSAEAPSVGQKETIGRLRFALHYAKLDEPIEDIGKRAHVDLSRITHNSSASNYAKYGKLPSTIVRATVFDWARFHNSNVLKKTSFGKLLQRPGWAMLDQLGPKKRTGLLLMTRANSAGSYMTKGMTSLLAGFEKASKGEDPTKDFLAAFASFGQGTNELVLGLGTDIGNHLARRLLLAKSHGPADSKYRNFSTDDPLARQVDQAAEAKNHALDAQVADGQRQLREAALKKIGDASADDQQLTLKDTAHDIAPQYYQMQEIGEAAKKRALELAKDTHENIAKIDAKAQEALAQLKALGFASVEAARTSGNETGILAADQLDQLAELKRSAYDVFNKALDESDAMLKQATEALREIQTLRGAPTEEAASRLKTWGDKYAERFAGVQDKWLRQTDSWPEWMKISKPLRMQLIPTGVNTVLGAIPFGIALDDYLKKSQNGTLTDQDRLNFAGACINLIAGPIGFVPVIGPFASIILTTVAAICGGIADQHDQRAAEKAEDDCQERLRQEYNDKHPGHEIPRPFYAD